MGELTEKAKGLANEAAGNTKQAIGKATDNERLRAEGEARAETGIRRRPPMGAARDRSRSHPGARTRADPGAGVRTRAGGCTRRSGHI